MKNSVVLDLTPGRAWHYCWFNEKDNYEDIVDGRKVYLTAKKRAKIYIKEQMNNKYFPFFIKKAHVETTEKGEVRVCLEGEQFNETVHSNTNI